MREVIVVENEKSRIIAINRFSKLTALLAIPYVFILVFFEHYFSSFVMLCIISFFMLSVTLNKMEKYGAAKALVVFTTNLAVCYFSIALGYDSGIHLYLYTSPLITYLLFDFKERKSIIAAISSYFLNFCLIYFSDKYNLLTGLNFDESVIKMLYLLNFSFSVTLSFFLIFYFANNNSLYIDLLKKANDSLVKQQVLMQREIYEKTVTHEKLKVTLKEKETLLYEIHHRVKNNLAIISGLLELQGLYIKEPIAESVLKESRNRIKSIALLHEKFYENKSLDSVDIRSYVDELLHFIRLTFSRNDNNIKIHSQIDSIQLIMEQALPFSLLTNELITNSFKHAFKGSRKGNIYISIIKEGNFVVFNYKDDGEGIDALKGNGNENSGDSLGFSLMEAFVKQLNGKSSITTSPNNGMHFKLKFFIEKKDDKGINS